MTVASVGRVSVSYNPASPDHSIATFKDGPQIVAKDYAGSRTSWLSVNDAQNWRRPDSPWGMATDP